MNYSIKILNAFICILISIQISFAQAPTNGLVAYYPFNNFLANDASGNNRNGIFSGGVSAIPDRYGNANQAYYFDGATGNITIPNWNILTGNTPRTMSVWFKAPIPTGYTMMLSWGTTDNNLSSSMGTGVQPLQLAFYSVHSNAIGIINPEQYFDSRWHLMTFTYDSSTMVFYLDGILQATKPNITLNTTASNLVIGSYNPAGGFFNGALDDVRVYNRALTAAEIQQMYLSEVAPSTTTDIIRVGSNKFIHTTGTANMFVGKNAGNNTTGANNTFLGNTAGIGITSGQGNVFLGSSANSFGTNMSTLQRSGAIGYNARVSVNDAIVLGDFENPNIKVGIGVHDPQYRLDVKGVINMRTAYNSPGIKMNDKTFLELDNEGEFVIKPFKIKYDHANDWSDKVFEPNYTLRSIEDAVNYAKKHKHLPNIPTAEEVVKNGVDMQTIVAKLLEKIEEQMLYIDSLNTDYKKLQNDYQNLQKRVENLEKEKKRQED